MGIEEYRKQYIECYNLVIDITKSIKDFLYPKKYNFIKLDETLPLKEQMNIIRKDLESMKFQKEIAPGLMDNLESYFCAGKYSKKEIEKHIEAVEYYFKPALIKLRDKLNDKYFPFIKLVEIEDYKDTNPGKYSDSEAWNHFLSDAEDVKILETLVEDIIESYMDNANFEKTDKLLKEHYLLQELEFNRYMNGVDNPYSSIIRREEKRKNNISVDFNNFKEVFKDIFGQDESIEIIRKTLLRNIFFYNAETITENNYKRRGPLATFMFYGPTGTGKTETAKKMAEFVYGNENKLLILDMNSYKDSRVAANAIKGL